MRDILTVMRFTMLDMIKRKSFIISTIIILLFIIIGFNIPNIINSFSTSEEASKIIIVDQDNVFEDSLDDLNNNGYEISIGNYSIDEIKEKISNQEIDAGLIITNTSDGIAINYIVENLLFMDTSTDDLLNTLSDNHKNMQIKKLNLSNEQ